MTTKGKLFWIITAIVVILLLVYTFRPSPKIDQSKVHPLLRGLTEADRIDWTSFGDGGSIVLFVTREDKSEVIICISNSIDQKLSERGNLYYGAIYYQRPGAKRIHGYDHTKYVIAELLLKNDPNNPQIRESIAVLTDRISDWLSFCVHSGPKAVFNALFK